MGNNNDRNTGYGEQWFSQKYATIGMFFLDFYTSGHPLSIAHGVSLPKTIVDHFETVKGV